MRMRRRTQGNSSTRLRLVVDLDRYSISPLLFFFFSFPRAALTRFLPDLSLEMSYLVPCSKGEREGRKEERKDREWRNDRQLCHVDRLKMENFLEGREKEKKSFAI